jgi:hypothetical protein
LQKKELHQTSHKAVLETTEKLKKYNIQVNPREINLFYEDKIRNALFWKREVQNKQYQN